MITDDKITEIFCTVDEFSKNFDSELEKKLHPRQPQGSIPNGSVVQPFRGVGEPRVLRHDVLPEDERVRKV